MLFVRFFVLLGFVVSLLFGMWWWRRWWHVVVRWWRIGLGTWY
jgi:hypothetical protein